MTGCYGVRVSITGVLSPGSAIGINSSEKTIADLLRVRGYATMCIGKWHLGDQPEFLPTRHGFDHYLGLPYSNDMQRKAVGGKQPVVPLVRDDKVLELLEGADQDRLTERYTEEATKFIRENREKPFFLYMPHTAVHVPIHPGAKFQDKSKNGRYGDWVEEVDWSVGRVLEELRELKLDKRTLVIFTSDNGPWLTQGKNGGEAGPLRGGKGSTWEGGMREPTLAWWPDRIAAGSVNDTVAGTIDLLPTFVALTGATLPTERKIDGRDISPLLLQGSKQATREAHFYFRGNKLEAVRQGKWKLALSPQPAGMGKDEAPVAAGVRLYDLDAEIGEKTDVASQHRDVVEKLSALAKAMAADLGDGKPGPGVRPAGRAEGAKLLYPAEPAAPKGGKIAKPSTAPAAAATQPARLEVLKVGDTVSSGAAPHIANQPFAVSCEVTANKPVGVILAHGGAASGFALHLKDGHVVFSVRTGKELSSIASPQAITGRTKIEAKLAGKGEMTLTINGAAVATGKAAGLIARQPAEDFCVGHDNGRPVADYDGAVKFDGAIENLKVTTGASR
jgi:arylsulfatase A-like enzyme